VIGQHAGFQQVTGASISIRIRDTQLTGATITDPFGKTRWTGGAESFIQTSLLLTTSERQHSNGGKHFSGTCVLEDGTPVEGCAIVLGRNILYSNSHGEFESRQKRNIASVSVHVEEFVAPGIFEVVEAPVSAHEGLPMRIVVRRK